MTAKEGERPHLIDAHLVSQLRQCLEVVLLDLVHDEVWPIVNRMHQGADRSLRATLLRLKDAPPARLGLDEAHVRT